MSDQNYFQYRCYGDHPWLKSAGEKLFDIYLQSRQRHPSQKSTDNFKRAFIVAFSGLYLSGAFRPNGLPVHISLNKNHYNGATRLSPIFQGELLTVFKWLISSGYLVQIEKEQQVDGRWSPRGYRLSPKWLQDALPDEHDQNDIMSSLRRNEFAEFIEVRNKDGRRLKLKKSMEKEATRRRLETYENRLRKHSFSIYRKVLPPFLFSLTRIYRSNYKMGGRYYSAFQTRSSQFRLQIEIDGEPVAESDYKALHPSLLYQMEGLEAPADPYDLGDNFPRSAVKKAFQVLINRSKDGPATKSLIYLLGQDRWKGKADPEDWQGHEISVNADWCKRLESQLRSHLGPIEKYFCKGVGLRLQYLDSQLVSHVIDYFMVYTNSIVLPIHDSFLVKQKELKKLMEAIKYAEAMVAKEMNKPIRLPTLKIEVSRPLKGYEDEVRGLGVHLDQKEKSEEIKPDVLNLEKELFENLVKDQYLIDFQIELTKKEEETDISAY